MMAGSKKYDLSEFGYLDSTKYSLKDFLVGDELDAMHLHERLDLTDSFVMDANLRNHNHVRRTSSSGSKIVVNLRDHNGHAYDQVLNFASNDYLNLTQHAHVIGSAIAALQKYGAGAGSVPLLAGTHDIHRELEERTAQVKGCEAAATFTSGFGANYGVLSTILRDKDVAILDTLAHASLFDGCKHSNQRLFRHNDMKSLEKVLKRAQHQFVNKVVIVDGVYSMDGDIACLDQIVALAHQYGALVLVDEAHATGVIGRDGRGTSSHFNIEGKVDIVCGTYSKALGGVGGYVAGSQKLINYIQLLSRPYVFSTAMPPSVAAGLIASYDVIEGEPERRARLWDNIRYYRSNLAAAGFDLGVSETAIVPITFGDETKVKELCGEMLRKGIMVNPVVFPAVPRRLSRIRTTVTADHTPEQIDHCTRSLKEAAHSVGI